MQYIRIHNSEQLADLVRSTRKEQKVTADNLAKFGDLSRYAVLKFENQQSDIKLSTLLKLLNLCGLELHIKKKNRK